MAASSPSTEGAARAPTPVVPPEPWKIGVHLPVSGPHALSGTHARNGAALAWSEINARGVLGRPVQLLIEDAGATNVDAQATFKKLQAQRPIAILGSISSQQLLAVADSLEADPLPILFAATASEITEQDLPWYFRMIHTDDARVRSTVRFMRDALRGNRVSSIHSNEEHGSDVQKLIQDEAQKLGNVEIVHEESVGPSDKDLSGQLDRAKRAGANIVVVNALAAQTSILIRQNKRLNTGLPIVGDGAVTSPAVLGVVMDDEINGVMASCAGVPQAFNTPEMARFLTAYQERFQAEPDVFGPVYYDAAYVLASAIEASQGQSRAAVRDALLSTSYNGLMYPLRFNQQFNGSPWTAIVQLQQKQPKLIQMLRYDG